MALSVQLREAVDSGQRGTQFMAGVGDELSHPSSEPGLFGGRFRGRHCPLNLCQHSVERQRKPADLSSRGCHQDPATSCPAPGRCGRLLEFTVAAGCGEPQRSLPP